MHLLFLQSKAPFTLRTAPHVDTRKRRACVHLLACVDVQTAPTPLLVVDAGYWRC